PSQRCQSAGERIRPSTQQTRTPPAVTHNGRGREGTHRHRLQFSPTANGIQPQPRSQQTQRTRSKQSPKEPHAEAIPHPPTTRRLAPCGHNAAPPHHQEETLALRAPSLSLRFMPTEKSGTHTLLPHAPQKNHPNPP
ncbi:hypothetical protein TcCL_Unassigned05413, partial [Trypanosoma cruzi]